MAKVQFLLTVEIPDNCGPENEMYWADVIEEKIKISAGVLSQLTHASVSVYDPRTPFEKLPESRQKSVHDWFESWGRVADIDDMVPNICKGLNSEELQLVLDEIEKYERGAQER